MEEIKGWNINFQIEKW